MTAAAFRDEVSAVAKGLVAAGVEAGDRVALISKTRYEWTLLDYAIWFAGAVTVPIYETSSAEQIGWILAGLAAPGPSSPRVPEHLARISEVRGELDRAAARVDASTTTPSTCSTGWAPTSPTTTSRSGVRPPPRSTWPR